MSSNSLELYHHGILGMKWGVRRTDAQLGRDTPVKVLVKNKSKHRLNLEEKYKSKGMSDAEAENAAARRIKAEKFVAVAGVITVAAATAYVVKKGIAINKVLQNEKAIQENMKHVFDTAKNNDIMNVSELPRIKGDHGMLDDLAAINPRYMAKISQNGLGTVWENNCGYCATAFEMRRRGFDVESISARSMTPLTPMSLFNEVKWTSTSPVSAYNNIIDKSRAWGDGARGMVQVSWKGKKAGGHAFSFEVKDGFPTFLDPQTNDPSVASYFRDAASVIFTRTDNLELKDHILDAVKIRRG